MNVSGNASVTGNSQISDNTEVAANGGAIHFVAGGNVTLGYAGELIDATDGAGNSGSGFTAGGQSQYLRARQRNFGVVQRYGQRWHDQRGMSPARSA